MYFHYPTWLGSMPDPSLVPPPPVIFKPCYFKPEKSTSAKHDNDEYIPSFADDDMGVNYGPEYVRPTPYPPPPHPPKKEGHFDYWAYTRLYNARPCSFAHAHEYPPFPCARPYGYPPSAYDSRYTHPHPHPHPHSQSNAPRSKYPRTSWSTQEATKAWRAKQRKLWDEWERRAGEPRQPRSRSECEDQTPPSSNPRGSGSNGGWREDWSPPRSPSPSRSDSGWRDRARYANGHNDDLGYDQDEEWSWEHRWPRPNIPLCASARCPSETRLSEAFTSYSKIWDTLLSPNDSKHLMFRNIPWPQYPLPRSVEDIDMQNVRAFLMAGGRPLKV